MMPRRPLLLPLVPVYAAALALKRRFATDGRMRLTQPVVSVGSLSAGGAGKTPVVEALGRLMMRHGHTVTILSRGYGRGASTVERVDPLGSAKRFGDEPLLLARGTGAAVYVGGDRYAAGLLAEREAGGRGLVHLLDDGFQHRRLARELDIVLLTREDAEDWLLPAGNLREPLSRLRWAGAIVLREEEEGLLRPVVERNAGAKTPVWIVRRELEVEATGRPVAFCGIARPEGFFSMLRSRGVVLAGTMAFADHHPYGDGDIARLIAAAREAKADGFVTTEKDAVKLPEAMRERLEGVGPVSVARLTASFPNEDAILGEMLVAARGGDSVRR